jgi:ABC-type multidrug transport system ATPase subunit
VSVRLSTRNLTFRYSTGRTALASLDLDVGVGEVFGVIGPNGSGKSTLLRLLAGTLPPTSGRIERWLDGKDGSVIAVVFDRLPFLEALSGRENIETALALRERSRSEAGSAATESLERFGLADRADDAVAGYSMGMRRRLALAEAFASLPHLLLLDEPTLGLDLEGRATLTTALRTIAAEGGTTVLTSNDADFVSASCDRVLLLHRGATMAQGPPAELVAQLGEPTIIEVDVRGRGGRRPDRPLATLPEGLELLGLDGDSFRIASNRGSARLAQLCAWLDAEGYAVRAIRIHAPALGDVFLRLAGVALRNDESA